MIQNEGSMSKKNLKGFLLKNYRYFTIVVLILVFFSINHGFLGIVNIKNVLGDSAPMLIMSCGVTFVLLLGSVDLSIGAVCSVANVLLVKLMPQIGIAAYFVTMLFGITAGLIMGTIHSKMKIPSFIVSLGFMSIWQSVALLISDSPVSIPKKLQWIIKWGQTNFGIISMTLILALVFVAIFYIVQTRTEYGRSIFAIGGNERAARIAGISIERSKITVYALNGLCSALGGIFLAAKLKSSAPTVGDPFTLLVIAATALGGTSLSGGKGSVLGTISGVFIVAIIRNGMNIIGVDAFWQNIVFGTVVLIAVALTVDRKSSRNMAIK